MKHLKGFLLALILISATFSTLSAREVVSLNKGWLFSMGYEIRSDNYTMVNLPHTWNSNIQNANSAFHIGMGSYIKTFTVPATWADKRVYIRFKGANALANLLVNGKHVGEHLGGYTAFTFDITPYLLFGQTNTLLVNVSNAVSLDVLPVMNHFNTYGGLYRGVDLIITNQNHISLTDYSSDGVYLTQREVTKESATVDALVKVSGRAGEELTAKVEVLQAGLPIFSGSVEVPPLSSLGKGEVTLPLTIETPRLWNGTHDPFMYQTKVSLINKKGTLLDEITVPLGLRYFSVDNEKGFFLNGEPYKLNGVNRHQDRSVYGGALLPEHNEEDIEIIKEMGANAIRLAEAPHDPYFYALADRDGLVIWSSLPFSSPREVVGNGFLNSRSFRENGERQLIEMIRQHYNHPSVLFWGIFDEINLRGDNPLDYIRQLNNTAHIEDPTRLTVAASNQDGEINFITDLIGWNHYLGWKSGSPSDIALWSAEIKKNWKQLKPALSEYGAGANIYHHEDSLRRPTANSYWHPERWQTYFHEEYFKTISQSPFLWGTFINSMFDYGDAGNSFGESRGMSDLGLVSFDRHIKKDAFYFYKANWNNYDPFVYIAERRWRVRTSGVQTIKVYTNLESAELWVNGKSLGSNSRITNGTLVWSGVQLALGKNEIIVRSGRFSDYIIIEIRPDMLAQ